MRPLERVPAVRRIETDRLDAFAVEVTGEFVAADAENLYGLLEGAFAISERVDLLVRIADLREVDLSGLSHETAQSLRDDVVQHVRRCAVVGDPRWMSSITSLFEPGTGIENRHFPPEEEEDAWKWVGAREIEEKV